MSIGSAPSRRQAWSEKFSLGDFIYRYALVFTWIGVIVVFSILLPNTFATTSNLTTILGSQSVLVIVTLGVILPLTVGEFDLSIGATLGFSAVVTAVLNVNYHWPIELAIAVSLGAGVVIGLVNGLMIVIIGVDAVIATVAMSTLLFGVSLGITNFVTISGVDPGFVNAIRHSLIGLPLSFYYGIGLGVVFWYVYRFTPIGRHLLFVGRNQDVARLSGLPVGRIRMGSFIVCGFTAAGAGVVLTGTLGAADPNSGASFLLPAFSAAFLGSTAINPGFFNAWGAITAAYFLVTAVTGLELYGLSPWVEQVFYGGALALAVTLSRIAARKRA